MKNNPAAFVQIVAVLRLTGIYLILNFVYTNATALLGMPSEMRGPLSGIIFRGSILPIAASFVLWFVARPIARLVLRDFDDS